jgi:hypothetical protein
MNHFVSDLSARLAAQLVLAAALLLAAAPAALAASGFTYLVADGNLLVRETHQSTSYLRRESKNTLGTVLESVDCPAPIGNCFPALPVNTSTYVVTLEGHSTTREEIVAGTCNGVPSAVPQLICFDGDLRLTMRVRTGAISATLSLLPVAPQQIIDANTSTMRMEFAEAPGKYWDLGVGSQAAAPAGAYRVFSQDLTAPCKPTPTNSGVEMIVPPGGIGTVTLGYKRTQCSFYVSIHNSDTTAAGVVASVDGVLDCGDPNRLGNSCTGTFPADTTVRFTGSAAPGYQVQFDNNPLSTSCNYPLSAPDRCDVRTTSDRSVRMEAYAGAAPPPPPPPPPVTLVLSAGAAMPADRVATKGAADEPMLQLSATAAGGTALIHALTLRASGSGRDDLDLPNVRLVLDANANGLVDAGETVLAQGRPTVDNGSMRLALSAPLALTSRAELLVVADIADTVHTAAAGSAGGGLAVAALWLWLWPGRARRRSVAGAQLLAAAAITALLVAACGGSDEGAAVPPVSPPVPPPVVTLTYRIELTGVDATDDASPAQAVDVASVPIAGALITVTP